MSINIKFRNVRFIMMRLLARYALVRRVMRTLLKVLLVYRRLPSEGKTNSESLFPGVEVDDVVRGLRKDGYFLGLNLPKETLGSIRVYARRTPHYGDQNERWGFYSKNRTQAEERVSDHFTIARYYNTMEECDAVLRLAMDPKLFAIAKEYLGVVPVFTGVNLWWSYANESVSDQQKIKWAQKFHHDVDDYNFLKFFFYLTDVDESGGPHVCIKGSHRKKRLRDQIMIERYDDVEIVEIYDVQDQVVIKGSKGFGFAEDTYCVHKGSVPKNTDRLLLQLCFAAFDYGRMSDGRQPTELSMIVP